MRRPWTPIYEELEGEHVCRIPLTQGLFAIIYEKHLSAVAPFTWYALRHSNTHYACTHTRWPDGKERLLYLHQLVAELSGIEGPVDHKYGDGLDCRSDNLRPGPVNLNGANRRKQVFKVSSQYKGVSWVTSRSKWRAGVKVGGHSRFLGHFVSEELAALAYDAAAVKYFGAYAKLNFPQEMAA
jgi:hypothetical protein